MKLSRHLLAAAFAAVTILSVGSAHAAPAIGALAAPKADTLVETVGGSHSSCEYGRRLGWHRHVGYYTRFAPCDPSPEYDETDSSEDEPLSGSYPSYGGSGYGYGHGYGYGYGHGYGNAYYRRPRPRTCHKDWHCRDNGNPFDGKRECYWRNLCN